MVICTAIASANVCSNSTPLRPVRQRRRLLGGHCEVITSTNACSAAHPAGLCSGGAACVGGTCVQTACGQPGGWPMHATRHVVFQQQLPTPCCVIRVTAGGLCNDSTLACTSGISPATHLLGQQSQWHLPNGSCFAPMAIALCRPAPHLAQWPCPTYDFACSAGVCVKSPAAPSDSTAAARRRSQRQYYRSLSWRHHGSRPCVATPTCGRPVHRWHVHRRSECAQITQYHWWASAPTPTAITATTDVARQPPARPSFQRVPAAMPMKCAARHLHETQLRHPGRPNAYCDPCCAIADSCRTTHVQHLHQSFMSADPNIGICAVGFACCNPNLVAVGDPNCTNALSTAGASTQCSRSFPGGSCSGNDFCSPTQTCIPTNPNDNCCSTPPCSTSIPVATVAPIFRAIQHAAHRFVHLNDCSPTSPAGKCVAGALSSMPSTTPTSRSTTPTWHVPNHLLAATTTPTPRAPPGKLCVSQAGNYSCQVPPCGTAYPDQPGGVCADGQ